MTVAGVLRAAAIAVLVAACSSQTAPHHPASARSHPAATHPAAAPSGPATQIASYPVRIGSYRLVNKKNKPVATTADDAKFPQSFSFAATARDGYYLPGHHANQDVYLIAGRLARGVLPSAAIGDYLDQFSSQEVHLTTEPAGPLGGEVKCWESGGFTFCMWADNGTYGVLDYRPPFGLDTVLIHHLAGVVPRFRRALERTAQ
jgi:hypothetical protein